MKKVFRCGYCKLPTDERFLRSIAFGGVPMQMCVKCYRDFMKRDSDLERIAQEVAENERQSRESSPKLLEQRQQSSNQEGKESGQASSA